MVITEENEIFKMASAAILKAGHIIKSSIFGVYSSVIPLELLNLGQRIHFWGHL